MRQIMGSLGISGVCIFFLLVIQFNSVVKPFMILLTIPLAAGGGLLGLYVMDIPMGFMEAVGMLALFGIVLSAAILLIEFSEILIKDKLSHGEGLAEEGEKSPDEKPARRARGRRGGRGTSRKADATATSSDKGEKAESSKSATKSSSRSSWIQRSLPKPKNCCRSIIFSIPNILNCCTISIRPLKRTPCLSWTLTTSSKMEKSSSLTNLPVA